jgi:hypothetical protein
MGRIEGKQVRHSVDVANGDKPGVVNLLADHTHCRHQSFPSRKNVGRVGKKGEGGLEN